MNWFNAHRSAENYKGKEISTLIGYAGSPTENNPSELVIEITVNDEIVFRDNTIKGKTASVIAAEIALSVIKFQIDMKVII